MDKKNQKERIINTAKIIKSVLEKSKNEELIKTPKVEVDVVKEEKQMQ